MKAGFAEVEYTPEHGFMPGQFEAYYANGARTALLANAAAFESHGETVILISADHLLFHTPYATSIRERISKKTGLPVKNILLAATHTHTGPSYDIPCWKTPAEMNVAQVVAHRIVEAGVKALEAMQDGASLAVATAEETRFSFCRDIILSDGSIKTNPSSKYDDLLVRTCDIPDQTIELMRVTREGKTVAILINFANHPDTCSGARDKSCADWPGYMRIALKEKYGEDVTVLFFNGCCGDVNHYDFLHKTHKTLHNAPGVFAPECIGQGMAQTIIQALDHKLETVEDEAVSVLETDITVKRRQITEAERAWADSVMERAKTEYVPTWEYGTAEAYIEGSREVPETETFTVTGYRVGPWGMIAMPGEMYTAVGKSVKNGSPFEHTIPVELANGEHGYVIPDSVRENGSYEGRFSSGTTGFGAMDAIIAGSVETLKKLY